MEAAITIDDQSSHGVDLSIDLPVSSSKCRNAEVLRGGVSIILISITQMSNPPIDDVGLNRAHLVLAMVHSLTTSASLVIGILLLAFSVVMMWIPGMAWVAERLLRVGTGMVKVTIGFGASLVLLVSSSSWLVLYLVFLTIQFLY